MKDKIEDFFEDFLNSFRRDFIEYFDLICTRYEFDLDSRDTKEIAENLLDKLFNDSPSLMAFPDDVILEMKKHKSNLGFLINRSTIYIYKKYALFMKKQGKTDLFYIENLLQRLNNFSNFIENSTEDKIEEYNAEVGFGNQNQIYSSNNILNIFRKMKKDGRKVSFMNLYKGIPISYQGDIVKIDKDSIAFKLDNELQNIAMKLESKAYMVKDKYLDRYIKADISHSDFSDNTIVLNNFVYLLNLPAIQREYTRIYPSIFVQVTLQDTKYFELKGNLYDLSMGGLGIISKDNEGFYVGASVDIKFKLVLQEDEFEIHTKGQILNIIEYMGSYRYCLKISPDKKNSKNIENYIKSREIEIIEELKEELNSYIF
jgi:hypothetical protein